MDAGEGGMAASPEEHRISIPNHNAGGSGESVGPGITEEDVSSLPSDPPNADAEWIRMVEDKIANAFADSIRWPLLFANEETGPKIRKLSLRNRISRPKLETEEGLSQPSVVAIGPFHRGRDEVSISDNDKRVIVGLMNLWCGLTSASCLVKMKNQVANARRCYDKFDISESSGFQDDKRFAEMLLLDSYFILFMLTIQIRKKLTHYTLTPRIPNKFTDRSIPGRSLGYDRDKLTLHQHGPFQCVNSLFNKDEIVPDLLIFDNQIPFFVIEELFKELKSKKPLHEYAIQFFETIHPRSAQHCKDRNSRPCEILHLLDLFHWSRVPQNKYDKFRWSDPKVYSIVCAPYTPNAMELRESAIVFKRKTSGSSLDITFRGRRFTPIIRVLDIPEFHIRNYSSLIFHNLIAFEIQSSRRGRCTMAFSALMRDLLQSEEDVKLLRQRGILVSSSMTDSQLVDLFARLSKLTENHEMPRDLFAICHQVRSYHNVTVSRFFRFVILGYFPNPQATFFVFVAALLFVPTILQTIYAMMYHN